MKFKILNKLALIVFMSFFAIGTCFAVFPPDAIELDGNVLDGSNSIGTDWQTVNALGHAAVETGVVADPAPLTIFTQGGSKDHNDPSQWHYKSGGGFPDKDDIVNGYAAAYFLPNGPSEDLVIYFGAERFSNKGDAFFGFWLFQDQVGIDGPEGGSGGFTGHHTEGDLFVLLDYPQGTNSQPFVQVMRWVDSGGDVDANLDLIFSSGETGAKCTSPNIVDPTDPGYACAITNDDPVPTSFWEYSFKGEGVTTTYPPETLFEGRVNVTQVLKDFADITDIPCFSSFMIETRASRSINAKLWDFIGGEFPLCSIEVTKTCKVTGINDPGTGNNDALYDIEYTLSFTNDGVGSIGNNEDITYVDTPSDLAGSATDFTEVLAVLDLPGELITDPGGSDGWQKDETLKYVGSYVSGTNGGSNSVSAEVSFGEGSIAAPDIESPIDPRNQDVPCTMLSIEDDMAAEKVCKTQLVPGVIGNNDVLVLEKSYDVEVCNTGKGPIKVTGLADSVDSGWTGTEKNLPFNLDFAKSCSVNSDCGANYSCNTGTLLCESFDMTGFGGNSNATECVVHTDCASGDSCNSNGFCEDYSGDGFTGANQGNFGGVVCQTRSGAYNPTGVSALEVPNVLLKNTVTVEAESLLDGQPLENEDSNEAMCQLCPVPIILPPSI